MKPWSRYEPMDVDMSRTAQFEGRTAEEAVARARAALGDSGALRCWKTRRGGVGGFFAKEVFVAGLTPPPGSETTRGRASRAKPGPLGTGSDHAAAAHAAPKAGVESASASVPQDAPDTSARPDDHLFQLVEGTSDQVSLGSLAIPAEAFDEVLAEAQAALTREREGRGIAIPPTSPSPEAQGVATEEPSVSEHDLALPEGGQPGGTAAGGETSTASRSQLLPDPVHDRRLRSPQRRRRDPSQRPGPHHRQRAPPLRRRVDRAVGRLVFRNCGRGFAVWVSRTRTCREDSAPRWTSWSA